MHLTHDKSQFISDIPLKVHHTARFPSLPMQFLEAITGTLEITECLSFSSFKLEYPYLGDLRLASNVTFQRATHAGQ